MCTIYCKSQILPLLTKFLEVIQWIAVVIVVYNYIASHLKVFYLRQKWPSKFPIKCMKIN